MKKLQPDPSQPQKSPESPSSPSIVRIKKLPVIYVQIETPWLA
jgi:hypothetical protein